MLQKITALLLPARIWLDANGGPGTAFGVLIVSVFLTMYGLRKWSPTAKLWERIANVVPSLNFDMTPGLAFLRKAWQGLFPTLVAAVVGALASGGSVKVALIAAIAGPITVFGHEFAKWLPFLPYTGAVHPAALAAPPKKSNDRDDDDGDGGDTDLTPPNPPRIIRSAPPPPAAALRALAACALIALVTLSGCALSAVAPYLAEAAVLISDAINSVDSAQALIPSLHLNDAERAEAEAIIAKARKGIAAAAAANDGAKNLTNEQLDASLADFRTAWADLNQLVNAKKSAEFRGVALLSTPLAVRRVQK